VDIDQRFRGVYCLHHQGDEIALMMESLGTSETSVSIYHTTYRIIPESRLHIRRRENLKSHMFTLQHLN
jgi:hypothetical protein